MSQDYRSRDEKLPRRANINLTEGLGGRSNDETSIDITLDLENLEPGVADPNEDFIVYFDDSSDDHKRMLIGDLPGGGGSGYSLIQDKGTGIAQRQTVNFIGEGVTVTDDGGENRTQINIPAGPNDKIKISGTDIQQEFLEDKLAEGAGITLNILNSGGNEVLEISSAAGTDESIRVSNNDTNPDSLNAKINPGTAINTTIINSGGNEVLDISFSGAATDESVRITPADTSTGDLDTKVTAGNAISTTVLNPGGNEELEIAFTGEATDELIRITPADIASGYLDTKIEAGPGISTTVTNPGSNERLLITYTGQTSDENVKVSNNDTTAEKLEDKLPGGPNLVPRILNPSGIEQLEFDIVEMMEWKGFWVPGTTYEIGEVVRDLGFTMVAINQTNTRPAPQSEGDIGRVMYVTDPVLNQLEVVNAKSILIGNLYTPDRDELLTEIKYYPRDQRAQHSLLIGIRDSGALFLNTLFKNRTIIDGSYEFTTQTILRSGVQYFFGLLLVPEAQIPRTQFTGDWIFERQETLDPADREVFMNSTGSIKIAYLDFNFADRTAELQSLTTGSIISFAGTNYTIVQVTSTAGAFIQFEVNPFNTPIDATYTFTFETSDPDDMRYAKEPGEFNANPKLSGLEIIDGVETVDDDGYPLDILVQGIVIDPNWQVVAAGVYGTDDSQGIAVFDNNNELSGIAEVEFSDNTITVLSGSRVKVDTTKVIVSDNDIAPGNLEDKLVPGENVLFSTLDPTNDESIEITTIDRKVAISTTDTTPSELENKLSAGENVTINIANPGGDELMELEANDPTVKITALDATEGFLIEKLTAGDGVDIVVNEVGGVQSMEVNIPAGRIITAEVRTLIGEVNLGTETPASSYTIDFIPQTFDHLLIKVKDVRESGTDDVGFLSLNNQQFDSSYTQSRFEASTSATTENIRPRFPLANSTSPANTSSYAEFLIPNYTSSTNFPTIIGKFSNGDAGKDVRMSTTRLDVVGAVTRVDLIAGALFDARGTFQVYGVRENETIGGGVTSTPPIVTRVTQLIERLTLSVEAASNIHTISNIDPEYDNLILRMKNLRSSGTQNDVSISINGNTTNSAYSTANISTSTDSVSSTRATFRIPNSGSPADTPMFAEFFMPDYTDSELRPQIVAQTINGTSGSQGNLTHTTFNEGGEVESISISLSSDNFASEGIFEVWGVRDQVEVGTVATENVVAEVKERLQIIDLATTPITNKHQFLSISQEYDHLMVRVIDVQVTGGTFVTRFQVNDDDADGNYRDMRDSAAGSGASGAISERPRLFAASFTDPAVANYHEYYIRDYNLDTKPKTIRSCSSGDPQTDAGWQICKYLPTDAIESIEIINESGSDFAGTGRIELWGIRDEIRLAGGGETVEAGAIAVTDGTTLVDLATLLRFENSTVNNLGLGTAQIVPDVGEAPNNGNEYIRRNGAWEAREILVKPTSGVSSNEIAVFNASDRQLNALSDIIANQGVLRRVNNNNSIQINKTVVDRFRPLSNSSSFRFELAYVRWNHNYNGTGEYPYRSRNGLRVFRQSEGIMTIERDAGNDVLGSSAFATDLSYNYDLILSWKIAGEGSNVPIVTIESWSSGSSPNTGLAGFLTVSTRRCNTGAALDFLSDDNGYISLAVIKKS